MPWNPPCPVCGLPVEVSHSRSRIRHNEDGSHTVTPKSRRRNSDLGA